MSTGLSVVSFSSCVSACLLHHSLDKVLWEDEVGRRAGQRAHASDAGRVDDAEADGFTNHQVLFTPAGSCSLSYSNLHQGKDSLLVAALAVSVIMDPTYSSWSWYSVLITPIKSFDGTSQEMWFSWTDFDGRVSTMQTKRSVGLPPMVRFLFSAVLPCPHPTVTCWTTIRREASGPW